MRGDAPPASSLTAPDRWPALAGAFAGALPVLYRYVYSSTGGDEALTEELTVGVFLSAARRVAARPDEVLALGPLHDAARAALVARAVGDHSLADPGRARAEPGDRGALRSLPYPQRLVLSLRYHDHLPVDEIAAALRTDGRGADETVGQAEGAFLAAAGTGSGAEGDGAGDGDVGERLYDLFATLDARPGEAYASRLGERMRAAVRAAPVVPEGPAARAAPVTPVVPEALVDPAPPSSGVAVPVVWEGPGGAPEPAPTLSDRRRSARVRTGRASRAVLVPAVVVTAVVLVATLVAGGDGRDTDDPAGAPPAPSASPGEGASRADGDEVDAAAARLADAVPLASAAAIGTDLPAPTTSAEVVRRVALGPGGPYMNGPYALDAGDEGLWAAAVGDDGTWQAVRVDPATGETLAEIRIPGRIPSDRSHHGITVSGGYVWTPALRDGIFRIDASTNTPSGIVAIAGGVVGAAMDGGDGAVWAVGNDSVLRRIDARTTQVTASALISEMGLMPTGVDVAYGGGTVWVAVADGEVRHLIGFDPLNLARRYHYALTTLGLVSDAYDLAADGDRVVLTETWPGGVTVVDGAAGQVVAQHRFASAGIAVDGDRAWVLSPMDGQATVVWTRTGELMGAAGVPPGVETFVSTVDGGVWAAVPSTGELVQLRFGG